MCYIFENMEMTRMIKSRITDTWVPKIVGYIEKANENQELSNLMGEMKEAIAEGFLSETGNT